MILVTGCTGFLGSVLVARLLRDGRKVRGLVRHPQSAQGKFAAHIEMVAGSITDAKVVDQAMEGVTQVIHLVGILVETADQTFARVHDEGTRNVVAAAKRVGVNRFLHMSSLGTRPKARSRYHQTKWRAEGWVRDSGLNATIFRPSVIFGPGDAFTTVFAHMARRSPVLPLLGPGTNRLQPVWIEDVAELVIRALDDSAAIGKTWQLGGPQTLTFKEILAEILLATGKRRLLLPVPLSLLTIQCALMERFMRRPPLTRDQLLMTQEDNICTETTAWSTYSLQPRAFAEGIRDYLR